MDAETSEDDELSIVVEKVLSDSVEASEEKEKVAEQEDVKDTEIPTKESDSHTESTETQPQPEPGTKTTGKSEDQPRQTSNSKSPFFAPCTLELMKAQK